MSGATHIALLRGVNVGGHAKIAMADLRLVALGLGLAEPRTLLQSGNLVFRAAGRPADIEAELEAALAGRFGGWIDVMMRTAAEWDAAVAANPFAAEARRDPAHLLLVALKEAPSPDAVAALRAAIKGREAVEAVGRHAYVVYPDGIGRSKLTGAMIEQRLGTRATGRNWNTALKLAEMTRP
ncbi:MAG TPA: DUF1697 domain-containing protein [Hyphomicrobiales bacterium]|nr:DUF1697 domain-containing protein [Hyphomicrobiales bacterium]